MTEEMFLKSTPKKIGAIWEIHSKFYGWELKSEGNQSKKVYIDEVSFL